MKRDCLDMNNWSFISHELQCISCCLAFACSGPLGEENFVFAKTWLVLLGGTMME